MEVMKSKSDGQLLAALQQTVSAALKRWLDEHKDEVLRVVSNSLLARETSMQQRQVTQGQTVERDNLLTVYDLAERWQFHPESVRRMIRQGRVPSFIVGRQHRVELAAVVAFEKSTGAGLR
jgi:hypothetical protein